MGASCVYAQYAQSSERKARRKKINGLAFCWWCTPCRRQQRRGLLLNSFPCIFFVVVCYFLSSSYCVYRFGRWELIEKAWFFLEKKKAEWTRFVSCSPHDVNRGGGGDAMLTRRNRTVNRKQLILFLSFFLNFLLFPLPSFTMGTSVGCWRTRWKI